MNYFQFSQNLEERDQRLRYQDKAIVAIEQQQLSATDSVRTGSRQTDNGGRMSSHQQWTPSGDTDIRKTMLKHWPKESRDEVWQRMARQVGRGDNLPKPPKVFVHISPEKMQ